MMTRRLFLLGAGTAAVALSAAGMRSGPVRAAQTFEVAHTEEEWRKVLTPEQFAVLRQSATERPFTSPLLEEHRKGVFTCAGLCRLTLFEFRGSTACIPIPSASPMRNGASA